MTRFVVSAENLAMIVATLRSTMIWIPKRVIGKPGRLRKTGGLSQQIRGQGEIALRAGDMDVTQIGR
jgi:hypothetical protein